MTLFQAVLLGIIQGLTEFLPISSTAHLRIVPALLGWADPGADFTAITQLGTLLAVLIYFARDIAKLAVAFGRDLFRGTPFATQEARLAWLIGLGTIPIAVCGLLFKDFIKTGARSLWVIAASMIGLVIALAWAERVGKREKTIEEIGWADGLAVGLAQAVALVPGSSRSGTTMTAGLLAGMTREAAARFSFLLSIPSVLLAGMFGVWEIRHDIGAVDKTAVGVATVVAFVFGFASIALLLRFLRTHSTFVFVVYRVALGLALVVLLSLGVLQAQ